VLENTFCHIPGVGPKTERRLWDCGVHSWQAALEPDRLPLSSRRARCVARVARESIARLQAGDSLFFYERMPSGEHWRLFPEFRHSVAYIDIETTGMGWPGDYITAISLYDGGSLRWYVHGENLDEFPEDIEGYRLLVTYNGKAFDLPFLRRYFRISMDQAHIDLRYLLASLGYRGGLKGCERQLGLDRGALDGVDGYFAVLLWHDYAENGNERALDTLLAYNMRDVVHLETLMVAAYNMKLRATPFARKRSLSVPAVPDIPFKADPDTIARIRRENAWL